MTTICRAEVTLILGNVEDDVVAEIGRIGASPEELAEDGTGSSNVKLSMQRVQPKPSWLRSPHRLSGFHTKEDGPCRVATNPLTQTSRSDRPSTLRKAMKVAASQRAKPSDGPGRLSTRKLAAVRRAAVGVASLRTMLRHERAVS
jgi:hypothetical protein